MSAGIGRGPATSKSGPATSKAGSAGEGGTA
jgi:hypothetical protein